MGRYPIRKANRHNKLAHRKHLTGRNRHHLIPRSRGGTNSDRNMLLIDIEKHELWHRLWGTRTIEEILALLSRMARMKKRRQSGGRKPLDGDRRKVIDMDKPKQERKPVAEKPSAIDKALKAMEELESLKQSAIEELLEQRGDIDAKLQKLGHTDHPKAKAPATAKPKDPTKPCSYCGEVGHDARRHRQEILAKEGGEGFLNPRLLLGLSSQKPICAFFCMEA